MIAPKPQLTQGTLEKPGAYFPDTHREQSVRASVVSTPDPGTHTQDDGVTLEILRVVFKKGQDEHSGKGLLRDPPSE